MVNNPGGNATPAFCLKYNEVGGRFEEGFFPFDDRPSFFFFFFFLENRSLLFRSSPHPSAPTSHPHPLSLSLQSRSTTTAASSPSQTRKGASR